jgi:hypothetical protein
MLLALQTALPFVGCAQSAVVQHPVTGMQLEPHLVYEGSQAITHACDVVSQVAEPFDGWVQSALVQQAVDGMHSEPHFL